MVRVACEHFTHSNVYRFLGDSNEFFVRGWPRETFLVEIWLRFRRSRSGRAFTCLLLRVRASGRLTLSNRCG